MDGRDITGQELLKLFEKSKFIHDEKRKHVDVNRAITNIVNSYRNGRQRCFIHRNKHCRPLAHIALLDLQNGCYLIHHHCSISPGSGQYVMQELADYLLESTNSFGQNQDLRVIAIYDPWKSYTQKFYRAAYDIIANPRLCDIEPVVIDPSFQRDVSDDEYGLSLSHYHDDGVVKDITGVGPVRQVRHLWSVPYTYAGISYSRYVFKKIWNVKKI